MPAPAPLISLIIVCRNPGDRLAGALNSIWGQANPPRFEIIVIDGASTDGTAEWLAARADKLSHWASAPDDGIYDAMNRGITHATGQWLYFLGADDQLASSQVLREISAQLSTTNHAIVSGRAQFDDGRIYRYTDSKAAIQRNFLHHQATFYHRRLFAQYGPFDTRFAIQADYDFNLRLRQGDEPIGASPALIALCESGGISDAGNWRNYREEILVRRRHFPLFRTLPWDIGSFVRYLRKTILRRNAKNRPE